MSKRAVGLRQVQNHVREAGLEQPEHAAKILGRDQRGILQLDRSRQQIQTGRMFGHGLLEQGEVHPRHVLGDVGQRVIGNRIQKDVGIAQRQIQIDQGNRIGFVGRQGTTQVDGQAGGADTATGAGNGDAGTAACLWLHRTGSLMQDPLEGRDQFVHRQRLRQKLLGSRPHRPQDQFAVVGAADDDDAAIRRCRADCSTSETALSGFSSMLTIADVRMTLSHHVAEELVARTFRLQPDGVHPEKHVLEGVTTPVVGIDDRQAQDISHGAYDPRPGGRAIRIESHWTARSKQT